MKETRRYGECGMPRFVGREVLREGSGEIALAISPLNRTTFGEPGVMYRLLRGMEDLVGLPVEHAVLEGRNRDALKNINEKKGTGKDVTRVVVQAPGRPANPRAGRRYWWDGSIAPGNRLTQLRKAGNIARVEAGRKRLSIITQNARPSLVAGGMAQAPCEEALGLEDPWYGREFSGKGNLEMLVKAG